MVARRGVLDRLAVLVEGDPTDTITRAQLDQGRIRQGSTRGGRLEQWNAQRQDIERQEPADHAEHGPACLTALVAVSVPVRTMGEAWPSLT